MWQSPRCENQEARMSEGLNLDTLFGNLDAGADQVARALRSSEICDLDVWGRCTSRGAS